MMDIVKGPRYEKIIGNCGEWIICNWLSRSGMAVTVVDHTGIDIIAYNPAEKKRMGITVKSRTREIGKEKESVNIFSNRKHDNDLQKLLDACVAFGCEPWLAVYIETTDQADIYMTSLSNYRAKYCRDGRSVDDWKMSPKYQEAYASDQQVKHIKMKFQEINWIWQRDRQKVRKKKTGVW